MFYLQFCQLIKEDLSNVGQEVKEYIHKESQSEPKFACDPLGLPQLPPPLAPTLSLSLLLYLRLPLNKRWLRINQKVGAAFAVSGLRWVSSCRCCCRFFIGRRTEICGQTSRQLEIS